MVSSTPSNLQRVFHYPMNQAMPAPGTMRVIQTVPQMTEKTTDNQDKTGEGRERVGSGSDSGNGSDEITQIDGKVRKH